MRRVLVLLAVLMVSWVSSAAAGPLGDAILKRGKRRYEFKISTAMGCLKLAQAVNAHELQYIEENVKEMRAKGVKESQEPLSTLLREVMLRKIREASLREQLRLVDTKELMIPSCEAHVAQALQTIADHLGEIASTLEQLEMNSLLKGD